MPVSWPQLYANRTAGMRVSDIREILKVTAQPEVISLAGGLPAPELFPVDEYRRAFEWVLETQGPVALQYGPSEGYGPLREYIAARLGQFGINCRPDDVLILVMYIGTFSKILAPGLRLGWIVAAPEVQEVLLHAKQPTDLHTGMAQQMATLHVAQDGFVDRHVERIRDFYRERRDVMLRAIGREFPSDVRFTHPAGGLFIWAELPDGLDARELLVEAVAEHNVAFVPGQGFHPDLSGANTLRLNFSNVPPERIEEGIRRLGAAIARRV